GRRRLRAHRQADAIPDPFARSPDAGARGALQVLQSGSAAAREHHDSGRRADPRRRALRGRRGGSAASGVSTRKAFEEERKIMPAYDPNNIFAKILRGELPCYKVYEDDKAFAFLDIMPRAPGHTLVLPKAPARNVLDVAPDDLAHVMKVAQKIAKAAMQVF